MKNVKRLLAMLLTLSMVFALAACGGNGDGSGSQGDGSSAGGSASTPDGSQGGDETADPITLQLAYMSNWGALWAAATADAKGYFEEEGITVEMTPFEDGPTEIAAMESGSIDIAYIGPGAHSLCSTGNAEVVLLQHLGDGDCIIGLKGITTLEELEGKTIGYSAGTSSETILNVALESVGLTLDDVNAMSMDSTALTTAALSGDLDAVAAWSPLSLTILAQAEDATDICSNADFASLVSPGSWVVNPRWADENEDAMVRFVRAMYKAMDYAAAATTDDAIAEEVAGYIAAVISSDVDTVIGQRYDGSWMTSDQVLEMLGNGEVIRIYGDQQATFIANGTLEAEDCLTPEEFVLTDVMQQAGN